MYSYGPPDMAKQKQDDQLEHTYSSYVRIRDVALRTCQRRWTIGRSGERGSGISVLAAWHDERLIRIFHSFLNRSIDIILVCYYNDNPMDSKIVLYIYIYIYIYIYTHTHLNMCTWWYEFVDMCMCILYIKRIKTISKICLSEINIWLTNKIDFVLFDSIIFSLFTFLWL